MRTAIVLAILAGSTSAQARPIVHPLVDGVVGVSVPVAGSGYSDVFYPSPVFGLHVGAEIWLGHHIGLAPELALDGGPFISQHTSGVTTGRFRFQPGLRVLFGFGRGHAFFLRWLFGGEIFAYGPGGREGAGQLNLGFATEPGAGMQFRVARHAVLGFVLGVPVGVHTFGNVTVSNVDFAASFFVGYR